MRNNFFGVFVFSLFLSYVPVASTSQFERNGDDDDGSPINVLWDIHHGVPPRFYHPDSINTFLRSLVEDMGHPLVVSDSGILNLDLRDFGVLIISVATTWDSPYSSEEVSIVRDFVDKGGGLLIMGDHFGFNQENINPVSQEFGTTTGLDEIIPHYLLITNLADHPLFRGVDTLYFAGAGQLGTVPPSQPIAWEDAGRAVVAVVEFGRGRVVITGDTDCFKDPGDPAFSIEENETFTRNIFRWILRLDCNSFEDLDETLSEAEINSRGVWWSLQSKADNARRQYERGNLRASGNILCALLHEVDSQNGKHIAPFRAREIQDCVETMAEVLGISLPCHDRRETFALDLQAFPNPFSVSGGERAISLDYSLSTPTHTTLKIYDVTGRLVRTLVDQKKLAERFSISWDGKDKFGRKAGNGVYFIRLTAGESSFNRTLVLLK